MLSPFILSEAQHAEACAATISHDQPLPQPSDENEEDWNLAGGSSAAGGGEKKEQQGQSGPEQGASEKKQQSKL